MAIARLLSEVIPVDKKYLEQAVISFTNTFYAAGIACALFLLFSILGYRKRRALLAVACIAASSILLPYSKIVQSETLTTFMLFLFLIIVAHDHEIKLHSGCAIGILYAALYFIKPVNIVFGSVIGLYVIIRFFQKRATASGLAAFCLMSILPLAVIFYFNWYRFGSILKFGYGSQQWQFTTPLMKGLAGFFFAPSKSMFLFSPLIIYCLFGFKRFFMKQRRIALCINGIGTLYLLLFAQWVDWKGGWAWGPRLIVPAIILIHIVLIEFVDREKITRMALIPFVALILLSTGIQFLGSLVSYQQIHYFSLDPFALKNSQIEVAAKLFIHKAKGRNEQYPCEMFHLDCGQIPYERDGKLFGGKVLSFEDKETFQGFATMWSGLSHNFGWRICEYVPVFLLIISFGCGWHVFRMLPAEN